MLDSGAVLVEAITSAAEGVTPPEISTCPFGSVLATAPARETVRVGTKLLKVSAGTVICSVLVAGVVPGAPVPVRVKVTVSSALGFQGR